MPKPQTFTAWLKTHADQPSAMGDLARDASADLDWPSRKGLPGQRDYLEERGAIPAAIDTLERVWKQPAGGGVRRTSARRAVLLALPRAAGRRPGRAAQPIAAWRRPSQSLQAAESRVCPNGPLSANVLVTCGFCC